MEGKTYFLKQRCVVVMHFLLFVQKIKIVVCSKDERELFLHHGIGILISFFNNILIIRKGYFIHTE
jgi:hypothetical protein